MHASNDVVVYVENGVRKNSLVIASSERPDITAGQTVSSETEVVEHLNLFLIPDRTQGVQNLVPLAHGFFGQIVFGVRPLSNTNTIGWAEIDADLPEVAQPVTVEQSKIQSASLLAKSGLRPGLTAVHADVDAFAVSTLTYADLPHLLGKIVEVKLALDNFQPGEVQDPQPEKPESVPNGCIWVNLGRANAETPRAGLWISPDMIVSVEGVPTLKTTAGLYFEGVPSGNHAIQAGTVPPATEVAPAATAEAAEVQAAQNESVPKS